MGEWAQLAASIGVVFLSIASTVIIRQHWKMIRQANETLLLIDQGIKVLLAASGVHLIRAQGGRDGEIELETNEGIRAKVAVTEIVKPTKLH